MVNFIFSAFLTMLSYYLAGKILFDNKFNARNINIFEQLIYGFIVISFISVLINFFYPLSKLVNTIFFFILIFIFFFLKKKIYKKEILILFFTSFCVCAFIFFDTINRPDGMLYHYPFSKIINEEKIILGISNIHFRFAHHSILQYSAAVNINYLTGDDGIIIPTASIYISILFYILNELIISLKQKNYSSAKVFLCLITLFLTYKINRYSKIGNDDIGHLISFLIIYKFLNYNKINFNHFKEIVLFSVFAIANKFTLIIICFISFIILVKNKTYIKKIFFSLSSLFIIIWLSKNLLISGCLFYPVEKTCLNNLSWTNIKVLKNEKISGEAWAKDWPNYENKENDNDMKNYIKKFRWLKTWSQNHFKIILKNILPFVLVVILLVIYNYNKNFLIKKNIFKEKFFYIFFLSSVGSIIFFLKFPLYRYGYSYLIILISLLGAILINHKNITKMSKIIKFTIILSVVVLSSKQFLRYYKFHDLRSFSPVFINPDLKLKKIKLENNFEYYLNDNTQNCWYNKPICTYYKNDNIEMKLNKNYKILSLKKK